MHVRLDGMLKLMTAKTCVVTAVLTAVLVLLQWGFTWWQLAIFAYCILVNNLLTDFWVLTTKAFIHAAEEIESALTQVRVVQ
jgi:hypothetical protein